MPFRLLPLFIVLLTPLYADAQNCKRETDEFKDIEKILCDGQPVTVVEQPDERITKATVAATTTSADSSITLYLRTVSLGWNFLNTDTAYFLADGNRIEARVLRTGEHDAGSNLVLEVKAVRLGQSKTRQISQADTVRMKMETAVFRLDPLPGQLEEVLRLMNQ